MPAPEDEQSALIERILATPPFTRSEKRGPLLRFLYANKSKWLSGKEIEAGHFGDSTFDGGHARERCFDLRTELEKYTISATGERWKCILPEGSRGKGFKLEFNEVKLQRSPSELFMEPHMKMIDDVIVVCGDHLFFFDPETNSAFRFYDFNVNSGKAETLELLNARQPKAFKQTLQPLFNSYLSTGEVHAHESLQRWFHKRFGVLLPRLTSRDVPDNRIHSSCPILLGRPATNKFVRSIMDSPAAAHLGYRIHSTLGAIRINDMTEIEKQALAPFPVTKDGVLGPVPKWGVVFGLATRLRNPSGHGHVTIISADYSAKVITRVAESFTSDKLAASLLEQMHWPLEESLPDSFEMLFSVTQSPGELEGEGYAKLLSWRHYPA